MSSTNNNFNSNNQNNNIQKNIRVLKSSEVIQNMIEDANKTIINYGIQIYDIYNLLKEEHGFTPEQASRFLQKKARVSVTNGNWTVERLLDGFDNSDNNNNADNNNNNNNNNIHNSTTNNREVN